MEIQSVRVDFINKMFKKTGKMIFKDVVNENCRISTLLAVDCLINSLTKEYPLCQKEDSMRDIRECRYGNTDLTYVIGKSARILLFRYNSQKWMLYDRTPDTPFCSMKNWERMLSNMSDAIMYIIYKNGVYGMV